MGHPQSGSPLLDPLVCLLCTAAFLAVLPSAATAQNTADADTALTLEEALRENSYPLRVRDGTLRGPGGKWLRERAKDATLISLGESHGTQEIPTIMDALLSDLQSAGELDDLALEVSPWTATLMNERLQQPDSAFTTFVEQHPAAIPFYALQPERDLVRNFVEQSASNRPLWGLDQIFAFATDLVLNRLAELAPTDEGRRAVAKTRAVGQADSTSDPTLKDLPPGMPPPLMVYSRATFDTLDTYFEDVDEAHRLLKEMAISTEIYHLNDTDNYRSNQIRARYLRRNLQRQYQQAAAQQEDAPQVAIKIGGYHAYRGRTPNNALDVGNLAVALAEKSGGTALNVAVVCGPNSTAQDYPAGTTDCWSNTRAPFIAALDNEPMLFDVTALHPLLHEDRINPMPELEKMLWAFDAVVLVPNAQPSSMIAPIIEQ